MLDCPHDTDLRLPDEALAHCSEGHLRMLVALELHNLEPPDSSLA